VLGEKDVDIRNAGLLSRSSFSLKRTFHANGAHMILLTLVQF